MLGKQNTQKAQESSQGVNERKDKKQNGKIGEGNSINISFLTLLMNFSIFTVLITTEAMSYLSYDRKSETHWVG